MQQSNLNFALATPEILLLVLACGILVVDAFSKGSRRGLTYTLTQASLALLIVVSAMQWANGTVGTTFNGLYVADAMSHLLKICSYIAAMVTLLYGRDYSEARDMT